MTRGFAVAIAVLAVLLLLPGVAQAQVEKGDQQVILNFSYQDFSFELDSGEESDSSYWTLNGSYGKFLTQRFQLSVAVWSCLLPFAVSS